MLRIVLHTRGRWRFSLADIKKIFCRSDLWSESSHVLVVAAWNVFPIHLLLWAWLFNVNCFGDPEYKSRLQQHNFLLTRIFPHSLKKPCNRRMASTRCFKNSNTILKIVWPRCAKPLRLLKKWERELRTCQILHFHDTASRHVSSIF